MKRAIITTLGGILVISGAVSIIGIMNNPTPHANVMPDRPTATLTVTQADAPPLPSDVPVEQPATQPAAQSATQSATKSVAPLLTTPAVDVTPDSTLTPPLTPPSPAMVKNSRVSANALPANPFNL